MKYFGLIFCLFFLYLNDSFGQTKVCFEAIDGDEINGVELFYEIHYHSDLAFRSEAASVGNCFILEIPNLDQLKQIILMPEKHSKNDLCISRNDLILARNFILSPNQTMNAQDLLTSIALDVDANGLVTNMDMVILSNYLDGTIESLIPDRQWAFLEKESTSALLTNPTTDTSQTDNKFIINTNRIPALLEFMAIRIGDVSGNCR